MGLNTIPGLLYEAYNRHDPAAVADLYHPQATHWEVAQGRTVQGAQAIAAGLQRFFGWLPDVRWEARSLVVDPSGTVAITYLLTAHGQRVRLYGAHVLRLAADRIRHSEDYWDGGTFQHQLEQITSSAPRSTVSGTPPQGETA